MNYNRKREKDKRLRIKINTLEKKVFEIGKENETIVKDRTFFTFF